MQELKVSEIEDVNGGLVGFIGGYIAGKALDAAGVWVANSYENYVQAGNKIEHSMVW